MAVYRRRICTACAVEARDGRLLKVLPECPKCGAPTAYTPQWYVAVRVRTPGGGLKKICKAVSEIKAQAEAEERRLLAERDQGAIVRPEAKTTFTHAAKVFSVWVDKREAANQLASGSARSYRYRLSAHLAPYFTGHDVRYIDHFIADEYVAHRRQQRDVRPATINREVATLKRLLSVAVIERLIATNPLLGYELLPEDNARDVHLEPPQISTLLAECQKPGYAPHLYPIVLLALHTGLRRDGCLTLRWEEIDWTRNEITKKVKGNTTVRIPMTPVLRATLDAWRKRDGVVRATGWLFPSPRTGGPMLVTSRFGFETAVHALGLKDVCFHTLRHSFATLFLEQFPDQIETLRTILGHSGAYMTRRYAHITDRSRHAAMAQFEIGG